MRRLVKCDAANLFVFHKILFFCAADVPGKNTGIILTKMDGTAKGGIAVAIHSELGIPVKYIGVGETIEDLQKFDSNQFVNALFDVQEDKSSPRP